MYFVTVAWQGTNFQTKSVQCQTRTMHIFHGVISASTNNRTIDNNKQFCCLFSLFFFVVSFVVCFVVVIVFFFPFYFLIWLLCDAHSADKRLPVENGHCAWNVEVKALRHARKHTTLASTFLESMLLKSSFKIFRVRWLCWAMYICVYVSSLLSVLFRTVFFVFWCLVNGTLQFI